MGLLVTLLGGRRSGLVPGILKISASHIVEWKHMLSLILSIQTSALATLEVLMVIVMKEKHRRNPFCMDV